MVTQYPTFLPSLENTHLLALIADLCSNLPSISIVNMSLSARFGKIEDSARSSTQKQHNNAKNGKQVIAPPRGPQGGARKQQRNDKQQKKNGQAKQQGKPVKQGQKGPKKST